MTKRSRARAKKYRIVLAVALILIVGVAVGYEYYQSQQESQIQQLQQNPISILKQFGVYDGNYSYVMFGSTDTNSILSSSQNTATYSYTYLSTPSAETLTETSATGALTYATTMTYITEYYTVTHITEYLTAGVGTYTSTYTWGTYSNAYSTNIDLSYAAYAYRNNTLADFSYGGPLCRWQDFGNGPFDWSGCKQFVLMIYNTETKFTAGFAGSAEVGASGYIVLNRMGFFSRFPLEWNGTSIDWQFYFFYASYIGS